MKKIALINDLSGLGRCSLTAAIPVISVMGIQACPLPTAILTAQTGFSEYFCDDYTDRMDQFTHHWKKMGMHFDGIYSGYLAGVRQVDKVLSFLEVFKKEDTLYLADPVMGDGGRPYDFFTPEYLHHVRCLTKEAEVITPNLTEACLLSGADYEVLSGHSGKEDYPERILDMGRGLLGRSGKKQQVIITGILRQKGEKMMVGNMAVSEKESFYLESQYTGKSFSGTGDLFASIVCASLVKGRETKQAIQQAVSFLEEAIAETSLQNMPTPHGVHFEPCLSRLCAPIAD